MTEHEMVKEAQEFFSFFQRVNWDEENMVCVQPGRMIDLADWEFYSDQITNHFENQGDSISDSSSDLIAKAVAEMSKNSGIKFYDKTMVDAWHNRVLKD